MSQTESDDSDEDPDGPSTSATTTRRPIWKETAPDTVPFVEPIFTGRKQSSVTSIQEPIEYFQKILDKEMLENIVLQSNLYAIQKNVNKPLNLTCKELEQFIGILFMMSYMKGSHARMYWCRNTRYDKIADLMTINRFEAIKSALHFNDNTTIPQPCTDKLFKIRPFLDKFNDKIKSVVPGEKLSIDEQVIPFKGRSSLRTYNPKKPHKWGYKIYVLSGIDGVVHNFQFYTGTIKPIDGEPDLKASGNIILHLLQPIPRGVWHKVYFDNWFTSVELQATLYNRQIACVGTVRSNRLLGCTLPTDSDLKKQGRGAFVLKTGLMNGAPLNVVKWFDNRGVVLLSTYGAVNPLGIAKRWDKRNNQYVEVQQPKVVSIYNKFMGGVDLLDSLLALYRIPVRSKKWYHRVIWHVLDSMVVQAWLIYRREAKLLNIERKDQHALLAFKISIAECLTKMGAAKRGRPSLETEGLLLAKKRKGPMKAVPEMAVRTDGVGHWPKFVEKKGRCKYPGCTGTPKLTCDKCDTYLCLTPAKNCFRLFHQ